MKTEYEPRLVEVSDSKNYVIVTDVHGALFDLIWAKKGFDLYEAFAYDDNGEPLYIGHYSTKESALEWARKSLND